MCTLVRLMNSYCKENEMNKLSIDELLQKNPDVKEIFEENARKLVDSQVTIRKGTKYGLALPYEGRQPLQEDQTDKNPPNAASYQRY